jgi:hypothetical protein
MKKISYSYFISFSYDKGFGNCNFLRNAPIKSYEDIKELQKTINREDKTMNDSCAIISFILLDKINA